jgi:hypothetical protein
MPDFANLATEITNDCGVVDQLTAQLNYLITYIAKLKLLQGPGNATLTVGVASRNTINPSTPNKKLALVSWLGHAPYAHIRNLYIPP